MSKYKFVETSRGFDEKSVTSKLKYKFKSFSDNELKDSAKTRKSTNNKVHIFKFLEEE
ncbi:MAG: hypothetical protein JEZ08_13255 [Clostridiales bacterium]|nr:hypothetical protein [Clostridiales bacterium]